MPGEKAHNLADGTRTRDVLIEDDISFRDFLLSERTLKGLEAHGFKKPSPIQRKAIPLGRCGFDVIIQAKSGTGKTCVFTVVALEMVDLDLEALQVLILSPTREISVQIKDVISAIGENMKNLKVEAFIGGMSLEADKKKLQKCQIAVGAPGRVRHLIGDGLMKLNSVRLFVLDEADKLMEDSFRKDISVIFLKLPEVKQVIASSATFSSQMEDFVVQYMVNPMRVSPGKDILLIGIRQFISIVPSHLSVLVQIKNKIAELLRILSTVPFKQCLVFSNYQSRAESICNILNKEGWPAEYINGSQKQGLRLKAVSSLKAFRCRVLLSTDLTSRGIDAENVNLVINLDLPYDHTTYMHRIGRAGRYGTHGLAITIVQSGSEMEQFRKMLCEVGGAHFHISLFPKQNLTCDIWKANDDDFEKIFSTEGEYKHMNTKNFERDKLETNNNLLKSRDKKEVNSNILRELLASQLIMPEKPELHEWEELVNKFQSLTFSHPLCSQNAALNVKRLSEMEKEVNDMEQNLCYDDFSLEEKIPINFLEKEILKVEYPQQKIEHKVLNEGGCKSDKNDYNQKQIEIQSSKYEQEICMDEMTDDSVDDDDDDDDDSSTKSDQDLENSKLMNDENLLNIKQWYCMWYSQLTAIRQYVNYLKYFYYWKVVTEK